ISATDGNALRNVDKGWLEARVRKRRILLWPTSKGIGRGSSSEPTQSAGSFDLQISLHRVSPFRATRALMGPLPTSTAQPRQLTQPRPQVSWVVRKLSN